MVTRDKIENNSWQAFILFTWSPMCHWLLIMVYNQKYFDCEFKTEITQINIRYWMYKDEIYGIM